jgi:capsular polysaccharide transport system permease protein
MSENQHNARSSRSLRAKAASLAVADEQPDQNEPRDTIGAVGEEQADMVAAGEQEISLELAQTDVGASDETTRLTVVPDDEKETVVAAHNPAALRALRLARAAARDGGGPLAQEALRLARDAARDDASPVALQALRLARAAARVPVRPVPVKTEPAPLESWPQLFAHDDLLSTMRQTRRRRFFTRLGLFVGVPTLLMALYLFIWATPRYVSEFEITYQTYQNTQSLSSGLVQSILGGSTAGTDFSSVLYEYIRSGTLAQKLDAKLNLRKYYSDRGVDYPARLSGDASEERFLDYYRDHIVSVSEGLGGYLTIDVHAFDPQFAHAVAAAIVQSCDEMIDQMTARARQDEMKFAEDEVARQEDRVRQAQVAETKFQNEHRDLNPTNSANQFGQIVGSLETQLSQARTALTNTLSYASPSAPQVQQLKNQIAALETQLQDQRNRLTGGGDKTYSQILEEYSRLQLNEQFAQNAYLSAQQGLSVARADAARKQSYLVDFVAPSEPNAPARSFYITYLAATFLGTLFLCAIGSLIVGAFRDQAGL